MKKSSALLFSVFSLAFVILIIWFITIKSIGASWEANIESLNNNWNKLNSLSTIWRLEALVVCGIAWAAFNLSSLSKWWYLVAIGHILMLSEYILMIGGYKEVVSEEMFRILNGMGNWVFIFSNLTWVLGMLGVYWEEKKHIRITGMLLTISGLTLVLAIYLGLGTQEQLLPLAMPVVLLIYLFNSYYGVVLFKRFKVTQIE